MGRLWAVEKQITLELKIGEITVNAHRGKMMREMKADSLADLVKKLVRLSLEPPHNE